MTLSNFIEVEIPGADVFANHIDIYDWCEEKFGAPGDNTWDVGWRQNSDDTVVFVYRFAREEDQALYVLTWLGK